MIKEFTVDVKKWARAKDGNLAESALLTYKGTMCCLGFLSEACGVPSGNMLGVDGPDGLEEHALLPAALFERGANSPFAYELMETNDDIRTDDKTKMTELKKLFETIGIEIKFINAEE